MKRTYHLHADDVTKHVYPKTQPPGGVSFKVYEILARDPETYLQRWCSAEVQQTAEVVRYEVEVSGADYLTDISDLSEWASDLEIDLLAETEDRGRWYGSTTFDNWPRAVVDVEVDDDDLEGIDPTSWEYGQMFLDRLEEEESGQPTIVPRPNPKPASTDAKESK